MHHMLEAGSSVNGLRIPGLVTFVQWCQGGVDWRGGGGGQNLP